MSEYTPTTEELRAGQEAYRASGTPMSLAIWLAAHDAEKRAEWEAEQEADAEPCRAELWSWDYFRSEQVDAYWMRCHQLGPHDEHENSETGAHWPAKREGEKR